MTLQNLTPQSADVALDPMQGTLQEFHACYCIGPQAGQPECPCKMRNRAAPDSFARAGTFQDEPVPSRGELERGTPAVQDVPGNVPAVNVNILALDLGTKTGYALRRRDGRITHGTQDFTPRKSWSEGQKWARYSAWLAETIREGQVHQVVYELVIRHEVKGRPLWDAAHAYGAFQAITHMVCDGFNVTAVGVNLATVKKSFTGSGRAKKAEMIAEARARGFRPETDNDADALAILHWAVAQERAA